MPLTMSEIPYIQLKAQEQTSFHIRPLRLKVDPIELGEGPHRHEFQELMWVKSGQGRHLIDQQELEIKPHTFYLIAQGQVHFFGAGLNLDGYLIRFTDDFLRNSPVDQGWNYRVTLFNNVAINHTLPVEHEAVAAFDHIIQALADAYWQQAAFGSMDIVRHLLHVLLIKLEQTRQQQSQNQQAENQSGQEIIFQEFIDLLERHYQTHHSVQHYADHLNLAPRQLSDIIKRILGKTTKQVIEERVVLEAKRYLRYSNYSVKEVTYALGFKDPSYFSKVFKRLTGISPQAYR